MSERELEAKLEWERAAHRLALVEAWQRGYDRAERDMPSCAVPCGACDECYAKPTANPYGRSK